MLMREQLAEWVRSNLGTLILAIILALAVWITASQEQNPVEERTMDAPVPIQIAGLEPGLVITNDIPTETVLRMRAQADTWLSLSQQDVAVSADLSGLGPGTHQVELNIELFAQAIAVSANPAQIRVILDEEVSREFPIELVSTGRPPLGFRAGNPIFDPPIITVTGPESVVEQVVAVQTTTAVVNGLREDYNGQLQLIPVQRTGEPVEGVTLSTSIATVRLPITQVEGFKDVAVRVVTEGLPDRGYYVTGPAVTPSVVTLQGEPETIDTLPLLINTLPININGLTEDLTTEIGLALPEGITAEPATVRVTISVAAQQGGRTFLIPVGASSPGEGLSVALTPSEVEVFLSGPLPIIDRLNISSLSASVDLTGLGVGTYQLQPRVVLNEGAGVFIESIQPGLIEVQILPEELDENEITPAPALTVTVTP